MILPQNFFTPLCFHFAFRHDFLSCRDLQTAAAHGGELRNTKVDSKNQSLCFFFIKKGPYSPNRANEKNPVNPEFILHSGHGRLEALSNRKFRHNQR